MGVLSSEVRPNELNWSYSLVSVLGEHHFSLAVQNISLTKLFQICVSSDLCLITKCITCFTLFQC